jgi:hypothetical protein
VKTNGKRTCEVCGTAFNENSEFCPVCALRGAISPETESLSEISSELCFNAMEFVEGATLENLIKRNRSDIVIERQTLQGLRTTVNLSQMDAAPLGLQMLLVSGSSGRECQKLGVLAKAR